MTTSAAYPAKGYSRPPAISPSGMTVTVFGESGEFFGDFSFENVDAPQRLVSDLVKAFAKATSSDGRWRSKSSVKIAAAQLRYFAADIAQNNPDIQVMNDFTPDMWWQWRTKVEKRTRWPGQVNLVRCLLYEVESLQDTTRRALAGRAKKPKNRLYQAYSYAEYRRIYAAAWRIVRQARRRISANVTVLQQFREGREPKDALSLTIRRSEWTRGRLLDHMITKGTFSDYQVTGQRMSEIRSLLGVIEGGSVIQAIFATTTEVFSILVLLVCERGFNLSVMNELMADPSVSDYGSTRPKITVQALDKPRRGSAARFFSASFAGKAARIWNVAHEITQPAREHMATKGQPIDKLLLGRVTEGQVLHSLFKSDWSQCRSTARTWQRGTKLLMDDGTPLVIDFRRLRLTEQVINKRSNQNSEHVSETVYRAPDPQTKYLARDIILQGQANALADASAVISVRAIKSREIELSKTDPSSFAKQLGISTARLKQLLKGALDTATMSCVNIKSSPFAAKGSPCAASFLMCFSCQNAIATPRHLPRLVTLIDALDEISSAVSEAVWRSDYMEVRAQISNLLAQYATEAELLEARTHVKQEDIDMMQALLSRRFDA